MIKKDQYEVKDSEKERELRKAHFLFVKYILRKNKNN